MSSEFDHLKIDGVAVIKELPPHTSYAAVFFSDRADVVVPLTMVSTDEDDVAVATQLQNAVIHSGGTAIMAGLMKGLHELPLIDGFRQGVLHLRTDGDSSDFSSTDQVDRFVAMLSGKVIVNVTAYGIAPNTKILSRVAELTGGHFMSSADVTAAGSDPRVANCRANQLLSVSAPVVDDGTLTIKLGGAARVAQIFAKKAGAALPGALGGDTLTVSIKNVPANSSFLTFFRATYDVDATQKVLAGPLHPMMELTAVVDLSPGGHGQISKTIDVKRPEHVDPKNETAALRLEFGFLIQKMFKLCVPEQKSELGFFRERLPHPKHAHDGSDLATLHDDVAELIRLLDSDRSGASASRFMATIMTTYLSQFELTADGKRGMAEISSSISYVGDQAKKGASAAAIFSGPQFIGKKAQKSSLMDPRGGGLVGGPHKKTSTFMSKPGGPALTGALGPRSSLFSGPGTTTNELLAHSEALGGKALPMDTTPPRGLLFARPPLSSGASASGVAQIHLSASPHAPALPTSAALSSDVPSLVSPALPFVGGNGSSSTITTMDAAARPPEPAIPRKGPSRLFTQKK